MFFRVSGPMRVSAAFFYRVFFVVVFCCFFVLLLVFLITAFQPRFSTAPAAVRDREDPRCWKGLEVILVGKSGGLTRGANPPTSIQ